MRAATGDTRALILEAATDLIQARGFDAFSYRDLAERVGIRAASIHYHFPAKEDLGVAVIEALSAWGAARMEALERKHAGAAERLAAYMGASEDAACAGEGGRVCPLGTLLAAFGALPPRMQDALRRAQDASHARLTRWLDEGRREGGLAFPGAAYDQALLVQAVMQHGMQQARACGGHRLRPLLAHLLATMQARGPGASAP